MKQLIYSDIYSWSIFSEMRQLDFNGHLWVRSEGNILIDPVPMIDSDLNQLAALGGAELIVITNCDHEREAEDFRKHTGSADLPFTKLTQVRCLRRSIGHSPTVKRLCPV